MKLGDDGEVGVVLSSAGGVGGVCEMQLIRLCLRQPKSFYESFPPADRDWPSIPYDVNQQGAANASSLGQLGLCTALATKLVEDQSTGGALRLFESHPSHSCRSPLFCLLAARTISPQNTTALVYSGPRDSNPHSAIGKQILKSAASAFRHVRYIPLAVLFTMEDIREGDCDCKQKKRGRGIFPTRPAFA